MGHVYRELKEIPLPEGAHINHYDGQVFVCYRHGKNARRRVVIGKAASETTMHPNDNFRFHFPQLWAEHYGDAAAPVSPMHVGLYALLLAAGTRTGLYEDVLESFGPDLGNALMDYAAFTIQAAGKKHCLFAELMRDQMLFSATLPDDTFPVQCFPLQTREAVLEKFRAAWLRRCADAGIQSVWLYMDCPDKSQDTASAGHEQTLAGSPVMPAREQRPVCIRAVSADTGRPVTWYAGRDSISSALDTMRTLLGAAGIRAEGVILEHGAADRKILEAIALCGMDCIAMLPRTCPGFTDMMARHMEEIRWEVRFLVHEDAVFGCTDTAKVFDTSPSASCVALLFDPEEALEFSSGLMQRVFDEVERLTALLPVAQEALAPDSELENFLSLTVEEGMVTGVAVQAAAVDRAMQEAGYEAVASSRERTAEDIAALVRPGRVSAQLFAFQQSQVNDTSDPDAAYEAGCTIAFLASILRSEIDLACSSLDLESSALLCEAVEADCCYLPDSSYAMMLSTVSPDLEKLLHSFGLEEGHLHMFADELTARISGVQLPLVRTLPSLEPTRRKRGRPATRPPKDPDQPKGRPGRPKGSRNKKTLERERELAEHPERAVPKRRPGRPKGSRNKKTLERERLAAERAGLSLETAAAPEAAGSGTGQELEQSYASDTE